MKRIGLLFLSMLLFAGVQGINLDSLKNEIITQSKEVHALQKDSILMNKLSSDQLMRVEQDRLGVEKQKIENEGRNEMPLNGFGIVMICLMPFVFVVIVMILLSNAKNIESKRRYDLYLKSLEMGQTIPDHFFDEPKKAINVSNLKKGILWLVVGIAVTISFMIIDEPKALFLGIVPTFVGIGYLLVQKLDKPKAEPETEKRNETRTAASVNTDEQHG